MTIQAKFFPDSKRFTKKRFHWAVQEALIGSEETLDVGPESKENFRTLHDVLEKKFIAS